MSLEGEYDPDNIFAKILRGEIPCHKIFEDETAIAFMDAFPQSSGHALIVPKIEARNIFEIEPGALGALMARVQRVAKGVRDALAPDGVIITQFNGGPAGQTVFHLHFHVIPRIEGQALSGHGRAGRADDETLAEQARMIAAAIE